MQAAMKLGEAMYKTEADEASAEAGAETDAKDENIVDADFEEVNDDDKGGDKKASA